MAVLPPTKDDVDMLIADPSLADQFDEVFGLGTASQFLGPSSPLLPDDEDLELLRELLARDPELYANQFDAVYGSGAAKRYMVHEGSPFPGSEGDEVEALVQSSAAPTAPGQARENAAAAEEPAAEQGAPSSEPALEPDPEDIELLMEDPSLAAQFDQMYGDGAAAIALPADLWEAASRGAHFYKNGQYSQALALFRFAVRAADSGTEVSVEQESTLVLNVARTMARLSRFSDALTQCQNAQQMLRKAGYSETKVLYTAAEARMQLCDFEGARRDANEVLRADPGRKEAKELLVNCIQRVNERSYTLLGLDPKELERDPSGLKKAYRAQCRIWHPDRHASSPKDAQVRAGFVFPRIQKAFEELSATHLS
eukprot:TRINITY_DN6397_c0_g1_i2.p1 TRINITY_DN6397_c0_g1~~TRINITY_DN6397_c0_g1_i2.p1  ORF type:complete len:369 (-),score=101.66 TRINITY_DN6397_c0_g1_i2:465-1571(-)